MKITLAILTFAFGYLAHAQSTPCNGNQEAQFFANYDNVDFSYAEAGNIEHTSFGLKDLDFSSYETNKNCPLDIEQAAQARIYVPGIVSSIQDGEPVSGILVYNPKFNTYSIEH